MVHKFEARIACIDDADKVRIVVKQYAAGWHVKEADGRSAYIGKFFSDRADPKEIQIMADRTAKILKGQFLKIGPVSVQNEGSEEPIGHEPEEDSPGDGTRPEPPPTASVKPPKMKAGKGNMQLTVSTEDEAVRRVLIRISDIIKRELGEMG